MPITNVYDTLRQRIEKSNGLMQHERDAWLFFKTYQTELSRWQSAIRSKADWSTLSKGTYSKRLVGAGAAQPGQFYFFLYDPKLRRELPYYDAFPLVLVLDTGPGWFFGMNLHYLNYESRARLFDALYPSTTSKTDSLKSRMRITYDILQSSTNPMISSFFRPCLKRYLTSHLQTPLLQVGSDSWHLALFLPVDMFKKKTNRYVWSGSV
jgi:hypothetical protein